MKQVYNVLDKKSSKNKFKVISFDNYLIELKKEPLKLLRNIFQTFHDMIESNVSQSDEVISKRINKLVFTNYDCNKLFVEDSFNPYFTDMIFASTFMKQMEYLRHGDQQNRIYVFNGPPGCGKSTFLNNLLKKFEKYSNSIEGIRYEILWKLDLEKLTTQDHNLNKNGDVSMEIPCVSHCNPFLIIPKDQREEILDKVIKNKQTKEKLFTKKEYEWLFKEEVCANCSSIYNFLLEKLEKPSEILNMLYAKPVVFNRKLGNGISVFNPGDFSHKEIILTNKKLQNRIDSFVKDSNVINYTFSKFAKTNNGIYALMDIKSKNIDRMIELHNIISEGIYKVGDTEESVNSLFFALMNPEDQKNINSFKSFEDRIQYIDIPYVIDFNTEIRIYNEIFGDKIKDDFLPMILNYFAKIIISTRIGKISSVLKQWLESNKKYEYICDYKFVILKLELFSGNIPSWLDREDRKKLDTNMFNNIIEETKDYGRDGLSGRDSIRLFDQFYSKYKNNKLINMNDLIDFFEKLKDRKITSDFLKKLLQNYNYYVIQHIKESLYYYNKKQIEDDIKNYITALTNELNTHTKCLFTDKKIHVTLGFIRAIEDKMFDIKLDKERHIVREDVLKKYTSDTLPYEMRVEGKDITETKLFKTLYERYTHNLKLKVLDPLIKNENFRSAIKDHNTKKFDTYDNKIQKDVKSLITNLCEKYGYTEDGANEVCVYILDNVLQPENIE